MKDDELPRLPRVNDSDDTSREVKQLRREADDARAELADSLHELRTRLSPAEMLAQTKASVQTITEQAKASVAAQVKRGAEDLRHQVALRSQQAVHAVQDRPAAVAASTAAAAGLFWFFSRDKHRNGHRTNGAGKLSPGSRAYPGPERTPALAGEVPGNLPGSARAPAALDPSDSAPHYLDSVFDEQDRKGSSVGGRWRHARPGPWTTGAAAAIVTTAVLAGRASSNQARQSGEPSQAHWDRAQAAARHVVEQTSERTGEVKLRVQRAVGRLAGRRWSLQAGPAAAVGVVIGIAAALLLPRTTREVEVSRQVQQSMKRSVSSATRRLAEQARRGLLPTLAALLAAPPSGTRGQ